MTRDELRDALTVSPRPPRRSTLLDWGADLSEADREELERLRAERVGLDAQLAELRAAVAGHARGERELRAALRELADAGLVARRRVLAGLRARGVL